MALLKLVNINSKATSFKERLSNFKRFITQKINFFYIIFKNYDKRLSNFNCNG